MKRPKLILVGAGPGDAELITLKGIKALQQADVVLYDALINRELLDHAPRAIKIFVGKRKGFHAYSQDEINRLIVRNAFAHGTVVRLKGGDPFIFGRGTEETDYAEGFGLETEVVPGITSSIAVPARQGISLTKRNVAESFWVVTGTTSSGKLSGDIRLAAQSTATVVILMGMGKLGEITEHFRNAGKGEVPVAVIQNGTTVNENLGCGTVNTIGDIVRDKKLGSPAIIVIGEVVRESTRLKHLYEAVNVLPEQEKYDDLPERITLFKR
ncbi:uroporphyrinogen-III C-methyltransferase [Sinomicrobium soli]|uniref:uroporphyrinogen-III C-methyltransferase n=1 Tax=Sinomicrobium sp. N-1-3-6 TaxID=2219864 RepID=UPI000DCC630E|nr:uroporphyrinogen-III C-methyltransferase [Sinomicrobium sp. N-1-3-6]RAV29868.1 uroporphyrinogen-III C-methyltransferase [Sinomicrobium sp. N-1-3-6]